MLLLSSSTGCCYSQIILLFVSCSPFNEHVNVSAMMVKVPVAHGPLCLQQPVHNNFTPAFFVIASAGMAVHYDAVIEKYGMCPVPVAIGVKNTGKSTAAQITQAQ